MFFEFTITTKSKTHTFQLGFHKFTNKLTPKPSLSIKVQDMKDTTLPSGMTAFGPSDE